MSGRDRLAEVLAAHADDGCGDCACSEYVLDVPFAAHLAEVVRAYLTGDEVVERAAREVGTTTAWARAALAAATEVEG